jgi:hypothetical protein
MFLASLKSLNGVLALGGVAHGAHQQIAVDASLDQVVLGALANGLDSESFIVGAGEDDDGDAGRLGVGAHERLDPVDAGQGQVEQDDIEILSLELEEGVFEARYMRKFDAAGGDIRDLLAEEAGVGGVVLDEQDARVFEIHSCERVSFQLTA